MDYKSLQKIFKNRSKQNSFSVPVRKRKRGIIYWTKASRLSLVFSLLTGAFVGIALLSASLPVLPAIWYRLSPSTSTALAQVLARPAITYGDLLNDAEQEKEKEPEIYQPLIDPILEKRNMIRIPKIGLNTEIIEENHQDFEKALRKGVWRVPDFGTPYSRQYPTILVAHRFGYLEWSNDYRRKNSFFNLPKLMVGDRIEIIWEQRLYEYEIIDGDEGEKITNVNSDLVIYTCKFLESPVRIFRYAKLLTPNNS